MKKYIKIITAVVICFIVAFIMLFLAKKVYYKVKNIRYERQIIEKNNYSLLQNIQKLTETKPKSVTLQEITDFEWDYVYNFAPYTNQKYIEDMIGMKSCIPLYFRGDGDETSILFMNKGKIVCYLGGKKDNLKCMISLNGSYTNYNAIRYANQNINTLYVEYDGYPRLYLADKEVVKSKGEKFEFKMKDNGKYESKKWVECTPN